MEIVQLVEVSDDSHKIACLNPELDGPAASERHLKEDGALDEVLEDRLAVLVHRRA